MWSKDEPWSWGIVEAIIFREPQAWPIEWTHHQDIWIETEKVIRNIVFFCHVKVRWGYCGKLETDMWSKGDSYFGGYDEVDSSRIPPAWPIRWTHSQGIWLETEKGIPNIVFFDK